MAGTFRFSFGPWNIHTGADPFGPEVRKPVAFENKLPLYKKLGFDAVQFHDDDAVPGLENLDAAGIAKKAGQVRAMLDSEGLSAEFVAPRLWILGRSFSIHQKKFFPTHILSRRPLSKQAS